MAKKKEKTLEEKLQEALVPENQWPYMLPENWCWVKLNKLYHVNPKNIVEDDSVDAAFIPMANIEPNFIGKYKFEVDSWNKVRKGHTQFADGDVTFAKISPCFENGKAFIAENLPNGIGAGTTELIVLRNRKIVPKYTFYLISTEKFVNGGRRTYSGVVGQQRISMDYVNQFPIPLPPLPEQKRIVHRIESLFAKLDEAKEKIQQVLDGAEMRKAAILHKAFAGELTQNWRKENGISEDSWVQRVFGEFCDTQYGYTDSSTFEPVGPKFLRITDIKDNNVNWDEVPYCQINADDLKKYKLHSGDIVVARTGATTGKSFLLQFVPEAVFASYLIAIKINDIEKVIPQYVYWFMQSPDYWLQITVLKKGSAQPGVNAKKIKEINIKIPSPSEQTKIVEIVKSAWLKESKVVIEANTVIDNIEKIKKSILAKAFRGELGTNNPTEDSAFNLLKEVLQDKS